jgi:hypothetical protein
MLPPHVIIFSELDQGILDKPVNLEFLHKIFRAWITLERDIVAYSNQAAHPHQGGCI